MAFKLSPILQEQQFSDAGVLLSGGKIETYLAGSSTPATTYTSSTGAVAQANPIILNVRGEVANPIYLTTGIQYKLVLKDSANNVLRTFDNIEGVNDSSLTIDQWVNSGVTPVFVNATQFTLAGDQTTQFQVDRRVKLLVSAGTVYGYISASVFGALTTVTVSLNSGALDSGLSSVQLGLITPVNTSLRVTSGMVADNAVTTDKIADASITPVKLSVGHPTWDAAGNTSVNGNFSAGIAAAGAKIHASGSSDTVAAGFVRAQNNNTGTGFTGFEFQLDATYTKNAIVAVRGSVNGGGYMGFYLDSNDDAANWALTDEKLRITRTGLKLSVVDGGTTLLPAYDCRVWVNFNGTGTVAIRGSGNVSSLTDNGVGDYSINFSTALPDVNYTTIGNCGPATVSVASGVVTAVTSSTTNVRIITSDNNTDVTQDFAVVGLAVFR